MIQVLRQLRWFYLCNQRRRTHPNIGNSWIEDLSGIDPLAKVYNSQIYGTVALGKRCSLNECYVRANSCISVGNYSILTGPIQIFADVNPVEIGKFCSFAPHVSIWESLHNHRKITTYYILSELFGKTFRQDVISKGSVRIGNDVWVGTRTVILSGVTIGDGAVIGAGSVVSTDIPPYTIAAGAPAAPLKCRFPVEIVQRLQQLRWWDWSEEQLKRNHFIFERELSLEVLDKFEVVGVP